MIDADADADADDDVDVDADGDICLLYEYWMNPEL